ncbi:MAG: transglycosylase SLT domain-containing protein [Proteobacteria bacterium]|nr:transglycosylase SLT domain-containing protein [Pseudomonadota bacterium]
MEEGTWFAARACALALLLSCSSLVVGCVGPTTPLGAVERSAEGLEAGAGPLASTGSGPAEEPARILFSPAYQQVHGPYTWHVVVVDPAAGDRPDPSHLRVFYNGLEVTSSARFQFRVDYRRAGEPAREVLFLEMPHLRLRPLDDHEIVVEYTTAQGRPLSARYPFPSLRDLQGEEELASTGPFAVEARVLEAVQEASRHYRINPVLLVALIAQESSFNPYALSKARALGLTQVTHLAEKDIALAFPDWPRYPGIQGFSRAKLRRLIPKVVNGRNEWRLDPVKSVWGGAHYLAYLRDRLVHAANQPKVALAGEDRDRVLAEASLAAYNSGLNRTLHWILRYRGSWLDQEGAREAKRYVRKILSYYGAFRSAPELSLGEWGEES